MKKTIDHITERKKPAIGKAQGETALAGAKRATLRAIIAAMTATIRVLRQSKSFSSNRPGTQPTVMNPQKQATACAPSLSGFLYSDHPPALNKWHRHHITG
jgi:hypothetical protein